MSFGAGAPEPRPPCTPAPLSFNQESLFLLKEMLPESPLFNVPSAWRIRGPLDVESFEAAVKGLMRRHESLRTRFARQGGELLQIPTEEIPPLARVDLAGGSEHAALELVRERARRPLGLQAPPVDATLVTLGSEDHIFSLVLHHIITDGWSTGVIERDLGQLYRAARDDTDAGLPALPLQYGDYAAWERQNLQGDTLAAMAEHWRKVLDGVPPTLELPSDRPRGSSPDFAGSFVHVPLPPGIGRRLGALGREHGATLYMVVLAALEVLLMRYTQEGTFVLGSPLAGRERLEFEDLVGYFVNTACIRADLNPAQTFTEVLGAVRSRTVEALDNQGLPFDALVAALEPERHPDRNPIFQVAFDFIAEQERPPRWAGLEVERIDVGHETAKFDLTVFAVSAPGGDLSIDLEYRSALFDRERIERLGAHLRALLTAIAADPTMPVGRLPLMEVGERDALLEVGLSIEAALPESPLWFERVLAAAGRTPEAIAVRHGSEQTTFAELEAAGRRIAAALRNAGVERGERVGICVRRSTDLLAAPLGVALAGAAFVPLDPTHPDKRLGDVIADSGARVVLSDETTEARVRTLGATPVSVRVATDPSMSAPSLLGADLAYVLYTSGSTGRPKGVLVEHRQIATFFDACPSLEADVPRTWRAPSSPSFDAFIIDFLWPLTAGIAVEIVSETTSTEVGEGAGMFCTPSLAKILLASEEGREVFRRLECLHVGGEVVPPVLMAELQGLIRGSAYHVYGPTETTVYALADRIEPGSDQMPLGTPLKGYGAHIVDREGELLPIGIAGEIWISGAGVSRGYLNQPRMTAERYVPDPWSPSPGARAYRSGDLAMRLPDGGVRLLGRLDHQVKISGVRVEPGEAEAVLREQPGVADVAVVPCDLGASGLGLVAFVVTADRGGNGSSAPEGEELRRVAATRLPAAFVPVNYVFLDSLPLLTSGKVDGAALRRMVPKKPDTRPAAADPQRGAAEDVREIWTGVLGRTDIGPDGNFFDYGGRSILLLDVLEKLQMRGYVDVSIVDLYRLPTPRALGEYLDGNRERDPLDQARGRGRDRRSAVEARRVRRKGRTEDRQRR